MTPAAYRASLARLGLSVASKATADLLRTTVRSSQRYASGEAEIPEHVSDRLAWIEALGGVDEARRILEERRK